MKKAAKRRKEKKPSNQLPEKPVGVAELTEQDLKQIQGGQGTQIYMKLP